MGALVPTIPEVRTFYFEEIPLRVIVRDALPCFVAKDVCHAINLSNPSMSVQALDEDERSKFNLGHQGEAVIISESGLYTFVLRCRGAITPGTVPHRFCRFLTEEVLPQVCETGTYGQPVPTSSTAALIEALKIPATALEVIGHYAAANRFGLRGVARRQVLPSLASRTTVLSGVGNGRAGAGSRGTARSSGCGAAQATARARLATTPTAISPSRRPYATRRASRRAYRPTRQPRSTSA